MHLKIRLVFIFGITLLVLCVFLILCYKRQSSYLQKNTNNKAMASAERGPLPSHHQLSSSEEFKDLKRTLDKEIKEMSKPADLNELTTAWINDSKYDVDEISRESYPASLKNICDFEKNFRHQIVPDPISCSDVSQSGFLGRIALTRRYAKLRELYDENPSANRSVIIEQFRSDVQKLESMKRNALARNDPRMEIGPIYDPNLNDQSDLPFSLATRLLASEMLCAEYSFYESLPLVLKSYDLRENTGIYNNYSTAFVCDKIMSSPVPENASAKQVNARNEYIKWKSNYVSQHGTYYEFFQYAKLTLPRYKSPLRPAERATTMMSSSDYSGGKVSIEIPETVIEGINPNQKCPIRKIIEYARQFSD